MGKKKKVENRKKYRDKTAARIALVAVAAIAARLAYLYGHIDSPFFGYFFLDPLWHHQWATSIASGKWISNEVFFRAPLYPYLLGIVYKLSGAGILAPRLLQFSMGVASSVLVYLIGRKVFDKEQWAVAGGIVFALYGPMIYFEGELLIPALIVFLDLLALWLLYNALEKDKPWLFGASGMAFGLCAVARPNVLAPAMILVLWMAADKKSLRERLQKRAAPFLTALMVPPMLVTIQNGVAGGDYVFIASQGGVNFHIGNNENADGKTAVSPGFLAAAGDEYKDSVHLNSVAIAQAEAGRELSPSAVSRFWYKKAFSWMAKDPLAALTLYGHKLFYLIHGHEIPSNNVPYFARNYSRALGALMWDRGLAFPAGIVIPLGIIGMFAAWGERRRWGLLLIFTLVYAGTIVLFFVTSRFRMPLIGPLILFAMLGVRELSSLWSSKQWKRLAPAAAGLAALLLISNISALEVRDDNMSFPLMNLGNYHYERGEFKQAVQYYKRVVEVDPDNHRALANLGTITFRAGDYKMAEKLYRHALEGNPSHPSLHNNLGLALEFQGDLAGAEACYRRALSLYPRYKNAIDNLSRVLQTRKIP